MNAVFALESAFLVKISEILQKPGFWVILSVLLIILLVPVFGAFLKRRRMLSQLRKFAKRSGWEITPIKEGYRSIFHMTKGENFRISKGDKKYSCKIITTIKRLTPLTIMPDGTCKRFHKVRFFKVNLIEYNRVQHFGYEADCLKILLLNPVPNKLMGVDRPIDNGDKVGDYKVFSGVGFINALDRGVVER